MDKSKLRPATPADLVEGNKIIVEDAVGAFVNGTVVQALGPRAGAVYVHGTHTYGDADHKDVEEDYSWYFTRGEFEDGRHGDYGLKLWVKTEAPAKTSREVELENALRDLTGNAELARFHMKDTEEAGILASSLWDTILQAREVLKAEAPVAWLLTNANGSEDVKRHHPGEWPGTTVEPLFKGRSA